MELLSLYFMFLSLYKVNFQLFNHHIFLYLFLLLDDE